MAQPQKTLATHSGIHGATPKSKGDEHHALFGCRKSNRGAVYTRILEVGRAIYFQRGVDV